MIRIKINIKILILAIILSLLMYPKSIKILLSSGSNIYIAMQLSSSTIQEDQIVIDSEKTKIIFMFDDGWESVYTEAYEILKNYDYKASIPIIPSLLEENDYMHYKELSELYLQGWNLLNHSYSHEEGTYDNSDELISDFNRARQIMKNRFIGKNSNMVVMPYGEINPYLIRQLKDEGYRNVRTSDNIILLDKDVVEYYPIYTISLLTNLSVDEVKALIDQLYLETRIIIIILHKISDIDDGSGMSYSKDKFEQIIEFIDNNRYKYQVITYSQLF